MNKQETGEQEKVGGTGKDFQGTSFFLLDVPLYKYAYTVVCMGLTITSMKPGSRTTCSTRSRARSSGPGTTCWNCLSTNWLGRCSPGIYGIPLLDNELVLPELAITLPSFAAGLIRAPPPVDLNPKRGRVYGRETGHPNRKDSLTGTLPPP